MGADQLTKCDYIEQEGLGRTSIVCGYDMDEGDLEGMVREEESQECAMSQKLKKKRAC